MLLIIYVMLVFLNHSGDFTIQFSVGQKGHLLVFKLLYHAMSIMLRRSYKLQEEKIKSNKIIYNVVYCKMLWSKYGMFVCTKSKLMFYHPKTRCFGTIQTC